jgi:hypothetical protein
MISSLSDASSFFRKWKEDETILDVFITTRSCNVEGSAVVRYFLGDWLELAAQPADTVIRIYLPDIVRFEFLTSADIPTGLRQGQPPPRIVQGWMLSTADDVHFQISELEPDARSS